MNAERLLDPELVEAMVSVAFEAVLVNTGGERDNAFARSIDIDKTRHAAATLCNTLFVHKAGIHHTS